MTRTLTLLTILLAGCGGAQTLRGKAAQPYRGGVAEKVQLRGQTSGGRELSVGAWFEPRSEGEILFHVQILTSDASWATGPGWRFSVEDPDGNRHPSRGEPRWGSAQERKFNTRRFTTGHGPAPASGMAQETAYEGKTVVFFQPLPTGSPWRSITLIMQRGDRTLRFTWDVEQPPPPGASYK